MATHVMLGFRLWLEDREDVWETFALSGGELF